VFEAVFFDPPTFARNRRKRFARVELPLAAREVAGWKSSFTADELAETWSDDIAAEIVLGR